MSAQLRLSATHMESGRRPMGAALWAPPLFLLRGNACRRVSLHGTPTPPREKRTESRLSARCEGAIVRTSLTFSR